jgi:predicted protein tyrosine phosphatase
MSFYNRIGNASNRFQGTTKKVLCVCSAGLLRSPTMAVVLSQEPYNYNTRAAGLSKEYALIPVDEVLLHWADEIVCAESWMAQEIEGMLTTFGLQHKDLIALDIPDQYEYRHPELIKMIKEKYDG